MTELKDPEEEKKEKYERRRKDHASFYMAMDDDHLLEEVSKRFDGCPDEMCFACLDNESLVNELRRRLGVDHNE